MDMGKYSHKGFTLIELLVVIAIVGILSGVIITSLNSAREQARDAGRIGDLKQLRLSLEENRSDLTGNYYSSVTIPSTVGDYTIPTNNSDNGGYYRWANNTSDNTRYCVWSTQEDDSYGYFIITDVGAGYATSAPTSINDCEFINPSEGEPGGSGDGGGTTDLCHFPVGNPEGNTNLTVNDGDVAAHLAHGDHTGDCSGGSQVTMCYLSVTVTILPINVSTYIGLGATLGPCS